MTQAIRTAIRILRDAAQELADGISIHGVPDWQCEPDTAAAYDETMAAVTALQAHDAEHKALQTGYDAARLEIESLHAQLEAIGAGGVEPLRKTAQAAQTTLTEQQAYDMGAKGAPATDAERLLFEAWMRGHCWALSATWDGKTYRSDAEHAGDVDPRAVQTRRIWAAWRDRAALAAQAAPAAPAPKTVLGMAGGYEHDRAIMEGERNASLDSYSRVVYLTQTESRIYEAAFTNGWSRHAARSAPQPPAAGAVGAWLQAASQPLETIDECNARLGEEHRAAMAAQKGGA